VKKVLSLCAVVAMFMVMGQKISWADDCPALGSATGCYVITVNIGGTLSFMSTGQTYLDGSDDPLIEVINNSGYTLSSLYINGASTFAFNGDGVCTYTGNCPYGYLGEYGMTLYEGPTTYFTNYVSTGNSGVVNFFGGLPGNGGSTYFSLETTPYGATATLPEPGSAQLLLLATAITGLGMLAMRLRTA